METPIVFQNQLPAAILRGLSRANSRSSARPSFPIDADTDSDDDAPPVRSSGRQMTGLPSEIAALQKMMGGSSLGGAGGLGGLGMPENCDCGDCPECRARRRRRRRDSKSLRHYDLQPGAGDGTPSAEYLARVAKPSKPVPSDHPLLVISLDGVLDARLPYHLSGGWTDVLARPYLKTFMDYLLKQASPWSIVFFTSLSRKKALKTMKSLKLPTGGPERDERDGVVGLFARDDMRGWNGGELELKDLEEMWDKLEDEEGVRWGPEDTLVMTDYPGYYKKQPANFLLVPRLDYKSTTRPRDDQFLLLMIAVLKDCETESNFAYHISQMEWNKEQIWMSDDEHSTNERNAYLLNAVRICADMRIDITAFTGN
ncbi:hypothetical protein JCM11641_008037 [Rhodosporidiobolus odoratus]